MMILMNLPKLKSFDRFGHRLDEVEFHPAYHNLMSLGLDSGLSASAWNAGEAGHVLHGAMMILMNQADAGVTCPMSMTYACVPALQSTPEIAEKWVRACRHPPTIRTSFRQTGKPVSPSAWR